MILSTRVCVIKKMMQENKTKTSVQNEIKNKNQRNK